MLHGQKEVSFVSIIMFILRPDALSLNGSVMIIHLRLWLHPTLSEQAPGGGVCSSMEIMTLEGKTAHRGGDVCVMCVSLAKSLLRETFTFLWKTHLAVKLLSY